MSIPAGWYPQPDGQLRYWDGRQWTDHFAPGVPAKTPQDDIHTWGARMPQRWLKSSEGASPARWAVGCHECGAETSFTGETSHLEAWGWHRDHFCPEEPRDDLAYLTLSSLNMTAHQFLNWARLNTSTSAKWVLDRLDQGRQPNKVDTADSQTPGRPCSSRGRHRGRLSRSGVLMSNRWLESRGWSLDTHWAVGCRDCDTEMSFQGEASESEALTWFAHHACAKKHGEGQEGLSEIPASRLEVAEVLNTGLTKPFLAHWTWAANRFEHV